jgi:fatty acid kinase
VPDPSLERFRSAVAAAYAELEARRQEVNDLNVFPVADGDTGDNMAMTMRAVLDELDRMNGSPIDVIGREAIVHAVARAALLGARGNSGVILSQIVRGAAAELVSRPGELVDPVLVAAALARAADAAYESVRDPAEGTMLSAVRAMAHRVAQELAHMDTPRLDPGAPSAEQDELLAEVLERALEAAKEAVQKGPDQLPVLREAGVVDAGAYGLTVLMSGVIGALRGDEPPTIAHELPARSLHLPQHESSQYRFCTNFAVSGEELQASAFVPKLEELGDSVLVVGDEKTLRVHVHTDDPDAAAALFNAVGEVSRFDVADMREQIADRSSRLAASGNGAPGAKLPAAHCGVVAVASGEGLVRLYEELGAHVVQGGATLNPSTYELLAGIHATEADELIVLPNSPNVILAAERAAELSERPVIVVPTRAQQTGLAALLAFDPDRSAQENADAVAAAGDAVRSGGVAQAARDDAQGRFREGDALGYAGEDLVAWGELRDVLVQTFARVAEGCEVLTCIAGGRAPLGPDDVETALPEGVELDWQQGDQPAWWYLLAAE